MYSTWQWYVCVHTAERYDEGVQAVTLPLGVELGQNYGMVRCLTHWRERARRTGNAREHIRLQWINNISYVSSHYSNTVGRTSMIHCRFCRFSYLQSM
jgi:hypothetical protein